MLNSKEFITHKSKQALDIPVDLQIQIRAHDLDDPRWLQFRVMGCLMCSTGIRLVGVHGLLCGDVRVLSERDIDQLSVLDRPVVCFRFFFLNETKKLRFFLR